MHIINHTQIVYEQNLNYNGKNYFAKNPSIYYNLVLIKRQTSLICEINQRKYKNKKLSNEIELTIG